MLKTQKGFTLIEALIALSITGTLVLVSSTSFLKLYDYINLNQTLAMIQADLAYTRQFNMLLTASNQKLNLKVHRQKGYYELITTDGTLLTERRNLPPGITLSGSENTITLSFNLLGHVEKGQTITVNSRYFTKFIVFSIGAGGIDIR